MSLLFTSLFFALPAQAPLPDRPYGPPNLPDSWAEQVMQSFGDGWVLPPGWVFICVLGIAALLFGLWGWQRRQRRAADPDALDVYDDIARRIRLPHADRSLLVNIAAHQKLPSPLTLLLSSATLTHHGRYYVESLPAWRQPAVRARLSGVRRYVFARDGKKDVRSHESH